MRFQRMNWAELVTGSAAWCPSAWRVWALWPSPVDHDSCFQSAGFEDFDDTDEAWDSEFGAWVAEVVAALETRGTARLAHGEYPLARGRRCESLGEALVAAARDDNFSDCVVTFGAPERASLRTSDGHAILWLADAAGDIAKVLEIAARYGELRQKQLDWEKLL